MWTDIDYMELRRLFTLDPERYPLHLVRQLVDYLHQHQQHYILMVNSAIWRGDNDVYNDGAEMEVWQKRSNGSFYEGAVWPGPTVFPDWFHPNTQGYWDGKFKEFFDPATGVDIDGLWNDMNEPANFCPYPCADPDGKAQNVVYAATFADLLQLTRQLPKTLRNRPQYAWCQRHQTLDQLT
jgi:alpha-glucosidase